MSVIEKPIDSKAGYSTTCRGGNHATCQTIGAKCSCPCHGGNGQTPPQRAEFPCPDCDDVLLSAAGLGRHRSTKHASSSEAKAKAPVAAVVIELVEEEPPPPPAPKRKLIDEILATLKDDPIPLGQWFRIAVFPSQRAVRAMATRLQGHEYGSAFEWQTSDDGRLFVRTNSRPHSTDA